MNEIQGPIQPLGDGQGHGQGQEAVVPQTIPPQAFATELIKSLVFIFSGGAGGYGLAKAKSSKSAPSSIPDDDE
jgi:hypothetical protein